MTKLRISDELSLPIETITQTLAVLAIKGAGKTNTAVVLAEEFLKKGLQVVITDPVGVWWGLRSSKDGKAAGLPIVIFGGERADVPLEPTGGALVADLVVDDQISAVLDLSLLRKGEQTRFMTDFAERLYHRKGAHSHRQPLHLILDEADAFCPQRPMHGQERMLGAVDEIVRRGRARGMGVTLITQRSAAINKDVLTQIEVLFAMRNISPQDRKAIEAWIEVHGTPEQQKELMASLPSLPRGTAWVWSPGWLDLFKKVKIRQRETFDSSATPKVGDRIVAPKRFADVDLEGLRAKMAATIEKAKAEDPKELRKRIAELEAALKRAEAHKPAPEVKEVPVFSEDERKTFDLIRKGLETVAKELEDAGVRIAAFKATVDDILKEKKVNQYLPTPNPIKPYKGKGFTVVPAPRPRPTPKPSEGEGSRLSGGERKILTVLAQYVEGRTKVQIALLCGYSHKGGGFNNYLSALRAKGFIETVGERYGITIEGFDALGPYTPLPSGNELQAYWLGQLGKAERAILQALIDAHPIGSLSKEELADITGYQATGGGFNNALSRLRTLELIDGRNELKAAEVLF